MNLTELRVARIRRGVKAQELADAIDRTVDSYIKRGKRERESDAQRCVYHHAGAPAIS